LQSSFRNLVKLRKGGTEQTYLEREYGADSHALQFFANVEASVFVVAIGNALQHPEYGPCK
tara:strand:+ start:171 stop:353 length:183 start_codon:yes stop_codon:yes gene_type:complete